MGEAIITRRGGGKLFAVIDVSYPAGAVCTCSNGTRTLKARGTGGHFLFNIPTAGDWTVTAVLDGKSKSEAVTVSEAAAYVISINFELWLYNLGDQCTDITGGWEMTGGGGSVDFGADTMTIKVNTQGRVTLCTANRVPLAGIKTLHFYLKCSASYPTGYPYLGAGKVYSPSIANSGDFCASLQLTESSAFQDVALDVLNCNDSYFIALGGIYSGSVTITVQKIWGEYE
mgnify:CR=1 FL=1